MLRYFIFLLVSVTTLFSCKFDGKDVTPPLPVSVVFDSLYLTANPIIEDGDTSQSYVDIKYIKTIGIGTVVGKSIAKQLMDTQLAMLVSATNEEDTSHQKMDLMKAAQAFLASAPTANSGEEYMVKMFDFEGSTDTLFYGKEVASFIVSSSYFTGGAHPNTNTTLMNFDRKTGQLLDVKKLVEDTSAFKKVLRANFEKNEKEEIPDEIFDMKNYFFEGDFDLPQNYAITREGLFCLYNNYEAAPYARGQITFTVPWVDLSGILTRYVPLDDVKLGDDLQ